MEQVRLQGREIIEIRDQLEIKVSALENSLRWIVAHPRPSDLRCGRPAGKQANREFIRQLGSIGNSLDGWVGILPPSDREVLLREQAKTKEERSPVYWSAQDIDGWVGDDLALFSPSGASPLARYRSPACSQSSSPCSIW